LDKERHPTKYGDLSDYAITNPTYKTTSFTRYHIFLPLTGNKFPYLCSQINLGTSKTSENTDLTHYQKIERKNLNFRTWIKRLTRKTICFSKKEIMHDTVIGLLINKVEFGLDIHAEIQV